MERIPFNQMGFINGDIAINRHGDEFQRIGDRVVLLRDPSESGWLYAWLEAIDKSSFRMKPKEDEIWGPWTAHDGSECPIPEVKFGEYQIKFPDGKIYPVSGYDAKHWQSSFWKHTHEEGNNHIIAYRIKKHLLKPDVKIIDRHVFEAPEEDEIPLTKEKPRLRKTTFPLPKLDQYILNYVHEAPKWVVHEDEGMSRLITNLMRK